VYWDNGKGDTVFATGGAMAENRGGGTIGNATVANGQHFLEALDTRRFDMGIVGRFALGKRLLSVRGSAMTQSHRHQFGDTLERDWMDTLFGEAALSGTNGAHTWVVGSAMQADLYRSHDVQRFDYTYLVPGVFVQDDYAIGKSVTLSGSGRLDVHNKYGTFFNPRISALIRLPHHWTARASTGTGVFVPSPFTEETEAVGLSRLSPLAGVQAERAVSASGDLGWSASHFGTEWQYVRFGGSASAGYDSGCNIWRRKQNLEDFLKVEAEARQDRVATDDGGFVDILRSLTRPVGNGAVLDRIQQPSEPRAVGDVFLHFSFNVG